MRNVYHDRFEGFKQALKDNNIQFDNENFFITNNLTLKMVGM